MKIEVGKWYLLVDNTKIRIVSFEDSSEKIYSFVGEDESGVENAWTFEGKYLHNKTNPKDIVKELSKEEYPELYL